MPKTKTMQTIPIHTYFPREVNLGDIFYCIEPNESKHYREPCKVCNDKRELTVNGVTFACPCCDRQASKLCIREYVVRKYRVCGITASIDDAFWKFESQESYRAAIRMYHKEGNGYGKVTHRQLYDNILYGLNPDAKAILSSNSRIVGNDGSVNTEDFIYDNYKLACSAAKYLNDREKERLDKYNEANGTSYPCPEFKFHNDSKN